uniref:Uncharacterized protein n=1 Tax=viral metagenome TaxID=1070528 RepID=A0A6C0BC23_9ZZZZ
MKFDNLKNFFARNKYILLSILVIVLFFYFVTPPFLPFSFTEGFTADKYKYLAPVPKDNTWSQDTMTKFAEKWNTVNKATDIFVLKPDVQNLGSYIGMALEEEATYYIQNGKWPYNFYITNFLNKNPTIFGNMLMPDGTPVTTSNISQMWPVRIVYNQVILQNPGKIVLPDSETDQTAYKIFMGTIPDPDASTSQTDISPITSSSLSSASTLSESNYNTLVSLCKNIIPV